MSKIRLLYAVLKQIRLGRVTNTEKKYHANDILYFQAKTLSIINPSIAPFHIDGDPANSSPEFRIRIVENAFRRQ